MLAYPRQTSGYGHTRAIVLRQSYGTVKHVGSLRLNSLPFLRNLHPSGPLHESRLSKLYQVCDVKLLLDPEVSCTRSQTTDHYCRPAQPPFPPLISHYDVFEDCSEEGGRLPNVQGKGAPPRYVQGQGHLDIEGHRKTGPSFFLIGLAPAKFVCLRPDALPLPSTKTGAAWGTVAVQAALPPLVGRPRWRGCTVARRWEQVPRFKGSFQSEHAAPSDAAPTALPVSLVFMQVWTAAPTSPRSAGATAALGVLPLWLILAYGRCTHPSRPGGPQGGWTTTPEGCTSYTHQ